MFSDQNITSSQILRANFAGGSVATYNKLNQIESCLFGGAGTLYYEYVSPTQGPVGTVYTYNERSKTKAATPITFVPAPTFKVFATNINIRGSSFELKRGGDSCNLDLTTSLTDAPSSCSSINLVNTTIYCSNQTVYFSLTLHRTATLLSCGLIADVVSFSSNSMLDVYASDGFYADGNGLFLSSNSKIQFGTYAFFNFTQVAELNGEISQVNSELYRGEATPTFRVISQGNVSVRSIHANKVLISGNSVNISEKSNLETISSTTSLNFCLENINASQTACTLPDTTMYNSIKWIQANSKITVGQGSRIQAAAVYMCSSQIYFTGNVTVSTDALGCKASNGTGMGLNGVYGSSGGGGAGYSGYGGFGFNNPNSAGGTFSSNGLLSAGSGGGCSAPSLTKCTQQGGFGGGVINIFAPKKLVLNANLSSGGDNGAFCGGGGSGGSISVVTNVLQGSGRVWANGGAGGVCAQPGM